MIDVIMISLIDSPLLRCGNGLTHHYERYNLSCGGFFFLVDCTGELLAENAESNIRVIQQKHDNFGKEFKNATPIDQQTADKLKQLSQRTKNIINSTLPPKQVEEQLTKLEQLYKKGILNKEEFEAKWKALYPTVVDDEGLNDEQKEMIAKLKG